MNDYCCKLAIPQFYQIINTTYLNRYKRYLTENKNINTRLDRGILLGNVFMTLLVSEQECP